MIGRVVYIERADNGYIVSYEGNSAQDGKEITGTRIMGSLDDVEAFVCSHFAYYEKAVKPRPA